MPSVIDHYRDPGRLAERGDQLGAVLLAGSGVQIVSRSTHCPASPTKAGDEMRTTPKEGGASGMYLAGSNPAGTMLATLCVSISS